jgi:NADH-quinone oxidoreductase subunit J
VDFSLVTFGALGGLAAISAIGVVAMKNAVRSALCLVINFFTLAFLYFTLSAELLGITQIIVYAGAIMVLFLFVIMLLASSGPDVLEEKPELKWVLGGILGIAIFGTIAAQVIVPLMKTTNNVAPDGWGHPASVGRALFSHYAWPFEMASILLLVGIVGSILLAKRRV